MKGKKMPAPRWAGTTAKNKTALEQLDWLRRNRPRSYDRLMIALAELVAVARESD